jgi:hypothetical protein
MRKKTRRSLFNYAVGYGRPPASSQFKPGQSGNPQGRPKGARNASSMARDELEGMISVKRGGKSRKMTVRQAAYRRLAEKAVAGDVKALHYLLSLESAERPPESDQPEIQTAPAKDLAILEDYFARRRRAGSPQHEHHDDPELAPGKTERGTK